MSEESHGRSGMWRAMVLAVVLSPVFYALSFGPAARMAPPTASAWRFMKSFYHPVFWLHDNTSLARPLEWYVGKWQQTRR